MARLIQRDKLCGDKISLLRKDIIDKSVAVFFENFNQNEYPDIEIINEANRKAENVIIDKLQDDNTLDIIIEKIPEKDTSQINISKELLKSNIISWIKNNHLKLSSPHKFSEIINWRMALSASIGTILGSYLITLLFSLIMNKDDAFKLGMIIGGALGAFLIVMFSLYISKNPRIKIPLLTVLGITTVSDIILQFNPKLVGGFSGLWEKIRVKQNKKGLSSFFKRLLAYLIILLIIVLPKRKDTYDLESYKDVVTNSIELWFDKFIITIQLLVYQSLSKEIPKENDYIELIEFLFTIRDIPINELPDARKELLSIASNIGIEGLDPNNKMFEYLTWNDNYEEQYNKYGYIENGDEVFVEKGPIIVNGKILKRGLVRKQRK